ncbi:hypothetical protein JMJ55_19175 [Belnapia sp. T6]|uniref:Uncharacterized protein n=1 Tax=Belnapia mucosa TaxID=2804532 RepID=A0ABS1V9Q1_9PROT|nr:hypothetical protein [Belnapia mucosa]MBL6457459.1 hypothetical protein [Belnapia mucosa]
MIILSLITASIGLPLLLQGLQMPADQSQVEQEDRARVVAAQAAITAVERTQHALASGRTDADVTVAAAARIMGFYRLRIDHRSGDGEEAALARRSEAAEREMMLAALKAERGVITGLLRSRRIGTETAHRLMREVDLLELRFDG